MYEEKEIKYKKRKEVNKKTKFKTPKQVNIKKPNFVNKIKWKELFLKLSILIIIMILIIFVISRINKNHQEKNIVLNKNIDKIVNATLKIYNNENLPYNIGDSNSLILEEIINQKIIKSVKDKNNKSCNTLDSYIIITKTTTTDFHLKIYLKCENEEITVEKDLICENTCKLKNS